MLFARAHEVIERQARIPMAILDDSGSRSVHGQKTEVSPLERHVRSTLKSRHRQATPTCPFRANSRHSPRLLTLNREAPHCAARLPTWQNNPLGETVPGMQGLKRVGRARVGTLSSAIAVLQ